MKLYQIARAMDRAGRMALVDGAELRTLELVVPVASMPDRDLHRFWTTSIVSASGCLGRWLDRLPSAKRNRGPRYFVRISWIDGAISAAPVRPPGNLQTPSQS